MEFNEPIQFIDEDSPQHYNYVWKKKKALQRRDTEVQEEKDFRQRCLDSLTHEECSLDDSLEGKTYFGKESGSSGDDIPDLVDEGLELADDESSLSPRAPLVFDEERESRNRDLEVEVNESDHERFALTSGLTVKEEGALVVRDVKTDVDSANGSQGRAGGKATESCRRVRFKEDVDRKRKCDKNQNVPPLTEEGLKIDVLFTDDVTIKVSFKEGKVTVDESAGDSASRSNADTEHGFGDPITRITEELRGTSTKYALTDGVQKGEKILELDMFDGNNENGNTGSRYMRNELDECLQNIEKEKGIEESNIFVHNLDKICRESSPLAREKTEDPMVGQGTKVEVDESLSTVVQNTLVEFDESTQSEITVAEESYKFGYELLESEKCSTVGYSTLTSNEMAKLNEFLAIKGDETLDTKSDQLQRKFIGESVSIKDDLITKHAHVPLCNIFYLEDIMEEGTCSDNSEVLSSLEIANFDVIDNVDQQCKHYGENSTTIEVRNNSTNDETEESSNSDSSLEKCEIESSEKEILKRTPLLNLLERQEYEEMHECGLELLQEFRSGLIPGITSATNWISCCDSDGEELSLGVVEEGGKVEEGSECGRRTVVRVSTHGAARRATCGAAMLSTYPPDPSQHVWDSDSESVQGDSLDTVIHVDSDAGLGGESGELDGTREQEITEVASAETPIECVIETSKVIDNSLTDCGPSDIISGRVIEDSEKEVGFDSAKVVLKDLFPNVKSVNALDNLPLIFPHVRGIRAGSDVIISPFKNYEIDVPNKCSGNKFAVSDNVSDSSVKPALESKDLKIENLFQFNVSSQHEAVTSFSEEVKDDPEQGEMKQKKKQQEEHKYTEEPATESGLCNGYHRGVLKSALKRNSSKRSKKKNRVQFNESLNKFFDADYVILIREEPDDFDGDYDVVGGCDCGDEYCYDECFEEDNLEEGECFQEPPSPRFDICAAFEPPVEFVDQVTLSPPDGYKDGSQYCPHHHHRPRRPDGKDEWQADAEDRPETKTEATNTDDDLNPEEQQECVVSEEEPSQGQQLMEQLTQQQKQRYIVETITMTTVTERRIVREADDPQRERQSAEGEESKGGGILKGGKLWKSASVDSSARSDETIDCEDEEKRAVRFNEFIPGTESKESSVDNSDVKGDTSEDVAAPSKGINVMSAKPNSAVRQLFPGQRFMSPPPVMLRSPETEHYQDDKLLGNSLQNAENFKIYEDAKKLKLQQFYGARAVSQDSTSQTVSSPQNEHPPSDDDEGLSNSLIKRTIERNTLRRSILRYPHDLRLKRNQNKMKNENSLVERIKQLTCDVDDESDAKTQTETRTSPSGEESQKLQSSTPSRPDKIASSGMSSTYKKLTDLFSRRDKLEAVHPSVILQTPVSVERQYAYYQPVYHQQMTPPDLGNGLNMAPGMNHKHLTQRNSVTTEARKQFLSSLAPLTACVSGNIDDSPGSKDSRPFPGDRSSIASSSTGQDSEYSLDDIEEALNSDETKSQPQPDVVAGTPAGNSDQDELALFVQQDAGRIERIRKRYSSAPNADGNDDDEHDDYGFNRRPSVRGIKPRFGSTTEILQQMQSQIQPPPLACPNRIGSHITWPYYTTEDPRKVEPKESHFTYVPDPNLDYAVGSPVDPARGYQHHMLYSSSGNLHQPMRIGGGGDVQYPPRVHHIHSESPPRVPAMGVMVPYPEHEFAYRTTAPIYARRSIPGSVVQMRVSPIPNGPAVRLPLHPPYVEPEPHYSTQPLPPGTTSIIRVGQQQTIRVPYPTGGPVQVHLLATRRSESPQRGSPTQQQPYPASQYARGTQTSSISPSYCNAVGPRGSYYHTPPLPHCNGPTYSRGPLIYTDHPPKPPHLYNNNYPPNPHRATSPIQSLSSSPTRIKPQNERGVPEGAASSSPAFPQDSLYQGTPPGANSSVNSETNTLPTTCDTATSPVAPPPASSVYYTMNV